MPTMSKAKVSLPRGQAPPRHAPEVRGLGKLHVFRARGSQHFGVLAGAEDIEDRQLPAGLQHAHTFRGRPGPARPAPGYCGSPGSTPPRRNDCPDKPASARRRFRCGPCRATPSSFGVRLGRVGANCRKDPRVPHVDAGGLSVLQALGAPISEQSAAAADVEHFLIAAAAPSESSIRSRSRSFATRLDQIMTAPDAAEEQADQRQNARHMRAAGPGYSE